MAVKGIVVEVKLGIEGQKRAVLRHDEWVHLDHGAVALDEKAVEVGEELRGLIHQGAGQAQRVCNQARLVGHQAEERIHRESEDLSGRLFGDRLDVNAAFRAGYDDGGRGCTVDQDGEVKLTCDVDGLAHEDLAHFLSFRTGLVGDQHLSQHLGC